MEQQKATYPDLKIPFVLQVLLHFLSPSPFVCFLILYDLSSQFLVDIIVETEGVEVVGIFRKSVESDLLASTKLALERGDYQTVMKEPILVPP